MDRHISRVIRYGWFPLVALVTVLIADMGVATANADRNIRDLLRNFGVSNPPENVASYIWTHPWAMILAIAFIFIVGSGISWIIEWCWTRLFRDESSVPNASADDAAFIDAKTRAAREQRLKERQEHRIRNSEPPPAGAFGYDDHQEGAQSLTDDEIALAKSGTEQAATYDQSFEDIVSDEVPYVRIRHIAHEFGLSLEDRDPNAGNVAYKIEKELRQAAVDGNLKVRGRKYRGSVKDNDPLVAILANHFEEYTFKHGCLHYDVPNDRSATAEPLTGNGQRQIEGLTYYDLYLSYADMRRILSQVAEGTSDGR